ncbi:hypothetical protein CKAN_01390500 [Cinnamomum micranthum f. kanehirae]|uniref:Uncharacterized protein n=1 Tax=Cinnamomum micranthum f. kanehirae TaxID=337451 RepID=A0A443P2V9_9MAGN|nr:hypothetical protein CKAN_01390500 [Cinnamomum micranthum f. kanehirae]
MTLANIVARALRISKRNHLCPGPHRGAIGQGPGEAHGVHHGRRSNQAPPILPWCQLGIAEVHTTTYVPPPFTCRDISDDSCSDTQLNITDIEK